MADSSPSPVVDLAAQPRFSAAEREALLTQKGIGAKVIERLEAVGLGSFTRLRLANEADVVGRVAALVGSTCWRNSPQARASVRAAIEVARSADPMD